MKLKLNDLLIYRTRINNALEDNLKKGSIVFDADTNKLMLFNGDYFVEIDPMLENIKENNYPKNCVNCGAVLQDNVCEYCGTRY